MRICDRLLLLQEGEVIAIGKPPEVFNAMKKISPVAALQQKQKKGHPS